MDLGYRVHLANPTAIKKYEGLMYSGDFADAAYLAHLPRLEMTESPKPRANDGLASTQFDSHTSCEPHGQGLAPTFLWGGERRQGASRAPRTA